MGNRITRAWGRLGRFRQFILCLFVAAVAYGFAAPAFELGGVDGLGPRPFGTARIDQGWDAKRSDAHHHTSQGTKVLPLSWFLALEQPVATPLPVGRYASRGYLARFGFNYTREHPEGDRADPKDPDLPVGFAIEGKFVAKYAEPPIDTPTPVVGLTCAACHTGRIDVDLGGGKSRAILVDGGSAMINLSAFQQATGLALFYTQAPVRFERFAREVARLEGLLGLPAPEDVPGRPTRKERLRKELETYVRLGLASKGYAREHKLAPIDAGFSRTDALGLIGNRVFGVLDVENQVVTDAPVNFPHLWDTAWFDWVQYNASIRTPMARNIGEALGVGALINLTGKDGEPYESTVNVENLARMEEWLGGEEPFGGLQPPRWERMVAEAFKGGDVPIAYILKGDRKEAGRKLYLEHCAECHLPPRDALKRDLESDRPAHFTAPDPWSGQRFLKLKVVDLGVIGTDPNQALNFYRRVAVSPEPPWSRRRPGRDSYDAFKKGDPFAGYEYESDWVKSAMNSRTWSATISAEEGLFRVTSFVRRKNYEALGLLARTDWDNPPTGEQAERARAFNDAPGRRDGRIRYDRGRGVPEDLDVADRDAVLGGEAMDWVIKKNLGYKARPLDGVWATAPFLHNGSVPSLHDLLSPVADRPARFHLGSTRFDPRRVGFESDRIPGSSPMDTSLPGNRNEGHEFRDLRLEELEGFSEEARRRPIGERWARALELDGVAQYEGMSDEGRKALIHEESIAAGKRGRPRVIRGLLGPAFTDEQKMALIEYLKSI